MRMRLLRAIFAGVLACGLAGGAALAQGNGHGHGNGKGKGHNKQQDDQGGEVQYLFGAHDREVISSYYSNHTQGLPPGLAKRGGNLPPGLEKQLERNGTLPPGLQKKLEPCPVALERQLPPLPVDYRRAVIGAHLVVYNKNTNIVVDIFKDVVR
ncbi:MAG: hypothetical protein NVS9B14_03950 [Candidatus Acidiferrum sp.]